MNISRERSSSDSTMTYQKLQLQILWSQFSLNKFIHPHIVLSNDYASEILFLRILNNWKMACPTFVNIYIIFGANVLLLMME